MRVITFKTPEIMVPLFKSLIRPILEYANAVWCPYKRMHRPLLTKSKNTEALHQTDRADEGYDIL